MPPWERYAQATPQIAKPWEKFSTPQQMGPNPQTENKVGGFGAGAVMGAVDPVYGIGQAVPHGMHWLTSLGGNAPNPVSELYGKQAERMNESVKTREENYQDNRKSDGFDWGRLTGNVVSPANWIPGGAVGKTASLGGKIGTGVLTGAAFGASQPVADTENFAENKAWQTGLGAAGGAVAPAVGGAVGRIMNPQTAPAVKGLLNEGVKLTPGEMAGGMVKRGEDLLSSLPGAGSLVKGAQKRSIESLNAAAINRALEPIGKSLPKGMDLGRDAVAYVGDTLGQAYDDLLPKLTGKIDDQFAADLQNLNQMVADDFIMNDATKGKIGKILKEMVSNRISQTGNITGQAVKEIESNLGDLATKLGKSLDPSDAQLADSLREVQDSLRSMLERTNPNYAKELKAINKGYANFKRVKRAAASVGASDGIFTPSQLQSAVKAADRSKDKGAFAKGEALMQDLSDPAKARMAPSVPNSGTADRLFALGALSTAGGGAAMTPAMIPAAIASLGYVPGGRRIAQALLTERPQAVRAAGTAATKYAPYLGAPLTAPLANQRGD